jgi:hypothetical protein
MLDPFTLWVLNVAGQVLAGVLKDSLTGERQARNRQVRSQATAIVKSHASDLPQDDLDYVVSRVLSEIRYLANEHPDLEWTRSGITVLPEVPRSVIDHAGLAREDVRVRLGRLERVVAVRRNEIEVATVPVKPAGSTDPEALSRRKEPPAPSYEPADIPVKRVTPVRDNEYWKRRLEDLEATTQARHAGLDKD